MPTLQTRSAEEIERSAEQLLQDLKSVVQDGEALLKATASDLNARSVAARERLASALDIARDTSRQLEERFSAGVAATDEAVRTNPYSALGLAFAAGLLAGILMHRS